MANRDGLFLGLDVGTQSTKGVLVDSASGRIVARASANYDLIQGLAPGAAEQHPRTWSNAVRETTAMLAATKDIDISAVRAVGVSGQQHGLVVLDAKGEVVRPAKLWCDTETAAEAAELSRELGRNVPCGFTAPKIVWMRRNEPHLFENVRSVLLPHDYINFLLTGKMTMEAGDASGTGFFDTANRRFDLPAVRAVDHRLESMLPPLASAGSVVGRITALAARTFGLPEGALVATGGGDNMMSALGSGATREGVVVVSLGTSGTAFAYSSRPVIDPESEIAAFCDSTGGWLPLLCTMNMTGVTEEVRHVFPDVDNLDTLTQLAEATPPGSNGLLFVPYLVGERVPNLPHAQGAILGIRPGTLRPGALFRAAIEGATANLANGVRRLKELGLVIDEVRVVGGGAKNRLWRQILADSLNAPLSVLAEPEAAALGAAIDALWTWRRAGGESVSADEVARPLVKLENGRLAPDPAHAAVYRALADRLVSTVSRLF